MGDCHECITKTNPEPCCGHDHGSNFGKPFGFDLVQVENPPWIPTAIGVAAAIAGYRMRTQESDLAVPLMLGGLGVPAMLWLKHSSSNQSSSEYGGADDDKTKTRDNEERWKARDNEKKKKLSTVIWKSSARSRNFGSPSGRGSN
jgi:hypothetical protein